MKPAKNLTDYLEDDAAVDLKHVQFTLPRPLFEQMKRLLKRDKITWQRLMTAAVYQSALARPSNCSTRRLNAFVTRPSN
jgi:hypothetical protein